MFGERLAKTVAKSIDQANQVLEEYRERMKQQVNAKPKEPKYKVGDIVSMTKPNEAFIKGLSRKLDNRNIGPFIITAIDYQRGNVTIQTAPTVFHETKMVL